MSTIHRYSIWIKTEGEDDDGMLSYSRLQDLIPGFVEASYEDSYEED